MKLYDVTLTSIAERKLSLLANSVAEAEMKALDIYLNTDLLDIQPQAMRISHVQADEVTTFSKDEVCKGNCAKCSREFRMACAFSDSAKNPNGRA